ncbi:MAG: hypothetical protein Q4D23_11940 [Bacteroidales bacterium]|nr:hypothetical protein [Bacteroidales bacterium]
MDFNVNVNVKLSLDSESMKLAWKFVNCFKGQIYTESSAPGPDVFSHLHSVMENAEPISTAETPVPRPTAFDPKDPSSIQTVTDPIPAEAAPAEEPSNLPFDNDANSEPVAEPVKFTWTPEDGRKARKVRMEYIENKIEDAHEREIAHKQMVKITKLYLQSAAYKHDRNEKGDAVTKEGLLVKKLDELDSDEMLRFMYLCESMFYQPEEKTVYPFDHLSAELAKCDDWRQVELDFVKTYKKK